MGHNLAMKQLGEMDAAARRQLNNHFLRGSLNRANHSLTKLAASARPGANAPRSTRIAIAFCDALAAILQACGILVTIARPPLHTRTSITLPDSPGLGLFRRQRSVAHSSERRPAAHARLQLTACSCAAAFGPRSAFPALASKTRS